MTTTPPVAPPVERPEDYLTFDRKGLPIPPWELFPYWPGSMGWRMGSGDWYLGWFCVWYRRLDSDRQGIYRRRYPAPLYWFWFYSDFDLGCLGMLAFVAVRFALFPMCFINYWWHRVVLDGVPSRGSRFIDQ